MFITDSDISFEIETHMFNLNFVVNIYGITFDDRLNGFKRGNFLLIYN